MVEASRREQFIESLKGRLDDLNSEMEKLEKKAEDASGKVEQRLEEQLADMREKRDQMRNKLAEVRAASEAQFERLKLEAEHAWKAFQNSVNYFRSHFK
ncbi:MAG: sll1863 family stress response protein [Wenzhouxiangella sp.]